MPFQQCDLVFALKLLDNADLQVLDAGAGQHCVTLKLDVDPWYWTPGRISTVSPFSLGAGAGQQCVALARHPGVVGRCPKKMKRTKMKYSSVGDPPPLLVANGCGRVG